MDLSHRSITGRQFELNRRGYDPDAVNAHLSEIATAVGERERRIAELESTIESLQAKVQDANESEEALRLTLKAAAHAKEELLAGARDQATQMEQEAGAKAEAVVSEATAKADELTRSAEARAAAIDEQARSRAGEVAQAALAESQLLVERIQGMRESVAAAEGALAAIQAETGPQIQSAREALDGALDRAKEIAEDPSVLERAAEEHVAAAAPVEPAPEPATAEVGGEPEAHVAEPHDTPAIAPEHPGQPEAGDHPEGLQQAEAIGGHPGAVAEPRDMHAEAPAEPEESVQPEADFPSEHVPTPQSEEVPHAEEQPAADQGPHLEVVEAEEGAPPDESAADISDKVDRLLEELREVT
ncbi:MAG: DivIVA domain-containing protein [Acidimicrobiia bacterium]|nr:DivIVA domain-containing protein [Acidimicrobiia bacterium]